MTHWINPPPVEVPASFSTINLPPLIARTLVRRGINDPASVKAFLNPDSYTPTSASELPGIDKAVERIVVAIRKNEPICVWGDFDVDGQTSTTLLVETLRALDADVSYHIPIRAVESHGVHIQQLTGIIDNGAKLILTCDTGITAYEAVNFAHTRGVDFVITDHHDLGETLPDAAAIVNPKMLPADHLLANLAGVGVSYKLAEALLSNNDFSRSKSATIVAISDLLDLVALGLVADLALLKNDTRYLAQRGLRALRSTQRLGLKTVFEFANLQAETLNETSVGFALGPRLNALGRLGDANPAVELFTTQDPVRARILAAQIEGLNVQRKLLTEQVTQAAENQLRTDPSLLAQPVIVLGHPSWPGGVVGIVANRLVDRYHKPAILFNFSEDGLARGSARSIDGLHITEAIASQKKLLHNFGGHPMAAGLALDQDKFPEFRKAISSTVEKMLSEAQVAEETLEIDAWLTLDELTFELADSIERLAPFGPGNPPLNLATHGLQIVKTMEIGKNKEHLKLTVADEAGHRQEVLWWKYAGEELPEGRFDLAYTLRAGSFRGERQLNLEFVEYSLTEEKLPEVIKPKIAIQDLRSNGGKLESLKAGVLIWAEGMDKARGKNRFDLHPTDEFAIWTAPASPIELQAALETVKPKVVYLFAVMPEEEKPEAFLTQLSGLVKFAVNKRSGKATIADFAAATAQREATVRLGLEWLRAGGHITLLGEQALEITISTWEANPYAQKELYLAIKGLLEETAAYRKYFATAPDPKRLLDL